MSGRYVPQCLVGMLFLANQFNMCLVGILFGIKYQYAIKFISANKSHWSSLNIDVLLYFFLSSSSSFQCLASKERFFSLSLSLNGEFSLHLIQQGNFFFFFSQPEKDFFLFHPLFFHILMGWHQIMAPFGGRSRWWWNWDDDEKTYKKNLFCNLP